MLQVLLAHVWVDFRAFFPAPFPYDVYDAHDGDGNEITVDEEGVDDDLADEEEDDDPIKDERTRTERLLHLLSTILLIV